MKKKKVRKRKKKKKHGVPKEDNKPMLNDYKASDLVNPLIEG